MEPFISLCYRTACYHCQENKDQIITAVPNGAQVVCDNCRATRVFVPVVEDIGRKGDYVQPGCYDIWNLTPTASCRHCGVTGPHEVTIGCRNFTVRCRNCGFTHLYRFNLEYIDDSGKIS
jgi:hypothetical protein